MKYKETEKIYKALANERRLKIIYYLSKEPKSNVNQIAEKIKLSFRSTSKHLQILKSVGLVEGEHVGLDKLYFLVDKSNTFVKHTLSVL